MAALCHRTGTPQRGEWGLPRPSSLTPLGPTEASSHTTAGVDARPPEQERANIKQENYYS